MNSPKKRLCITTAAVLSVVSVSHVAAGDAYYFRTKPSLLLDGKKNTTMVEPLQIAGAAPASVTVGDFYSAKFSYSGGELPVTWSLSGDLPDGLSFLNGVISGSPIRSGTWSNIIVRVTGGNGKTSQAGPFSITTVNKLQVAGSVLSKATVGVAYSSTLSASGGDGNYTWSVESGNLPDGLTLNNGKIVGSPTTPGTWSNIVVAVTDSVGRSVSTSAFSVTVSDQLKIVGIPDAFGTVGASYTSSLTAAGGAGGNTWNVTNGTLPLGLDLGADGTISGTPSTDGTWSNISVRVSDKDGRLAYSQPFSIKVSKPLTITASLPTFGTVGVAYSATLSTSGGAGGNHWSVVSGSLPKGLVLSNGVIVGTPSEIGDSTNIVLEVQDDSGQKKQTVPFSINIANMLSTAGSLSGSGKYGTPYTASMTASGGRAPYTWTVNSGSIPTGTTLLDGTLSGTPSGAATYNFGVTVTDRDGRSTNAGPFSIFIDSVLIREPAAGELDANSNYGWRQDTTSRVVTINWGGKMVGQVQTNMEYWVVDGTTYYRGDPSRCYMQGKYTWVCGLYRTYPAK